MVAAACVDCLEDALREHGKLKVFNRDMGSQFPDVVFSGMLYRKGIAISMDGWDRVYDNILVMRLWTSVKHKDVPLSG